MNNHLPMILKSGQFHHWEEKDGLYALVNGREAFFATERELVSGDRGAFDRFFDAERDYRRARETVLASEDLRDLAPYLGLRILRQDPWEAMVGFILSANNNLVRIRRTVLALAARYGDCLKSAGGLSAYALPDPARTASLSAEELRALGAGYRDRYLIGAARMIAEGSFDIEAAYRLSYPEAKRYLMRLPGVGKKVADCILLFGYGKLDAFPVDVWIEKAMARFGTFPSREATSAYGMARFGGDAGYIQQLLFMYEREKKS
ncbi:MAG: hypothetical protein SPI65_02830 [Peptoniphilus sp.]|nr:hypothetical protein [Peptoniphilus sp.]MDD7363180.1 hypothetical protein [Bacillota bacterium]MDY6044496.1 hypothetical protein [Peptoniphilus sp.]